MKQDKKERVKHNAYRNKKREWKEQKERRQNEVNEKRKLTGSH